ncbi:MAG: hypothetical protein LBH00_11100 [Planctomycetaceae bacterium]|jgi:hypothetical protein|nr:hypothetical protein [Planctomycetaceae bacterium]
MNHEDIIRNVRNMLLNEWDPLGVRDEPTAQDEYNLYADEIVALMQDAPLNESGLLDYLNWVLYGHIGLSQNSEQDKNIKSICAKLIFLFKNIE